MVSFQEKLKIAITCNLLEKERAIVGGSHFGHEPRVDDWENDMIDNRFLTGSGNISYLPSPTILHRKFVEWNDPCEENTTVQVNGNTRCMPSIASITHRRQVISSSSISILKIIYEKI